MQTWHKAEINKVIILLYALFSSFPPENMFAGVLKVKIYNAPADAWYLIIDTFAGKQQLFASVNAGMHWLKKSFTICNK